MIHEEICTCEVCKLAKEKGFPQDVFGTCEMKSSCYLEDGRFYKDGCIYPIENAYTAPTQGILQRWLREAYAIDIDIYPIFPAGEPHKREYGCQVYAVGKSNKPFRIGYAKTYENMLESALKYALENLV
jgi:hypothetical protein